ncbi:branched-chain-amino-acid aminotransferase [Tribonema minus]|uniref:Branched-chain-amino-acid aminotransferase n=1 Tax=Tribonema minus TaxID=303371 RepID=A0A836CGN0_9STRA|nr:branched-chain-amino-acid aminotransferase [Tribonema minus]
MRRGLLRSVRQCSLQGSIVSRNRRCLTSIPSGFTDSSPHVKFPPCAVSVSSPNAIDASALKVTKTSKPMELVPKDKLVFGRTFADHMLEVDWDSKKGWRAPVIRPFGDLSVSPAASVLHYALECFEGMKAYKDASGCVRLFRPALNMARFNHSLARMYMPAVDGPTFLSLLRELLLLDEHWIPEGDGYSLYIRPTAISTTRYLGVGAPEEVKLYCITSPVGPYYATGFKPISLWADTHHVRAWEGGTGDAKVGANYAIAIMPQMLAAQHGCSQVLWMNRDTASGAYNLTEVGSMNLFVLIKDAVTGRPQLITAPLTRADVLPGVTRASILELAESMDGVDVKEACLSLQDVAKASAEGRLMEIFGAGTAAVVAPVNSIKYADESGTVKTVNVPSGGDAGPTAKKLWATITDIQYGRVDHPWSVKL